MSGWQELPKAELHCHLLGVISPALLREVEGGGAAVLVAPGALDALHPVSGVASFQRWVDALKPYQTASPELMRPILAAHAASLIAQGVVYTEIMLSPAMFPADRRALLSAFHRWREWAYEMERGAVQIEFLLVIPRTLSPESLEHDTELCIDLRREDLVTGVALVGIESGASIERFRSSFLRWRDAGLGIEVHAGEHSGPESVWDALQHGFPDRLGHAISAFRDEALLERIRSAGVHIEFCPTSNLQTGAVPDLHRHPIQAAKQLGIKFSLNTDDPGAFGCSMTTEYERAAEAFGFTREDFREIFRNSLAARFAPKLRYLPDPGQGNDLRPADAP
jgi:adenosine deaminase